MQFLEAFSHRQKYFLSVISIILLNSYTQMAENQTKAPVQKSGEMLSDDSKTGDVRMSNIIAAKGTSRFVYNLIYSCRGCYSNQLRSSWYG